MASKFGVNSIRALHQQDEGNAVRWFQENGMTDQIRLWMAIQRQAESEDPETQLIARCAQLGFVHAWLLAEGVAS